ncbi:MAG: hypothetical protein KDK70_00730 [Myxococcales bacterium]|nr:hypothetical protein [Myxococcales bacterium]
MADISFRDAFVENMQALGWSFPSTFMSDLGTLLTAATAMVTAVQFVGAGATMAELASSITALGASTAATTAALELILIAGAAYAAYFIGNVIGSILVAAWRSNAHEFGMVLNWAREQFDRLGQNLMSVVHNIMDSLDMRFPSLLHLLR